jgi:hypothetical protein
MFGITNKVTKEPKTIPDIIVMARGFHIESETIDVSQRKVVRVVNIIG